MRTKTVIRHYCDHCSKGFFKRPSAEAHEKVCFRNPNRVCPFCHNASEFKPDFIRFSGTPRDERRARDGECPWCLMGRCVNENIEAKKDGDSFIEYPIERFKSDCLDWRQEEFLHRNG
jgi:hypothetical protein